MLYVQLAELNSGFVRIWRAAAGIFEIFSQNNIYVR